MHVHCYNTHNFVFYPTGTGRSFSEGKVAGVCVTQTTHIPVPKLQILLLLFPLLLLLLLLLLRRHYVQCEPTLP